MTLAMPFALLVGIVTYSIAGQGYLALGLGVLMVIASGAFVLHSANVALFRADETVGLSFLAFVRPSDSREANPIKTTLG